MYVDLDLISESEVSLVEEEGVLAIMGIVKGLGENPLHGFHIHQNGDLSDGCTSCGGHFNPYEVMKLHLFIWSHTFVPPNSRLIGSRRKRLVN